MSLGMDADESRRRPFPIWYGSEPYEKLQSFTKTAEP
ncbi:hypothetical protein T05_10834 [Trichinella murrelli]|uniref:Uncharacterized protein n=1 Tax=Trichinella murrelli TaxID=144512 RepID=A0A0V0SM55_9BILA|nr:hypothetical protein T05_10834 [Trichinella murrelli]